MDVKLITNAVELVKQREGILNSIQDKYITAIVNGVIEELERDHHIKADMNRMDIFMFVVDLSAYRYSNRDSLEGLPKNLEFRLKNLYLQRVNDVKPLGIYNETRDDLTNAIIDKNDEENKSDTSIDRVIEEIKKECRDGCK